MQNFKFGGVTVLAVQLFNKIKRKEKTKNMKKTCFAVFPRCYVEINLFLVNLFFFVCSLTSLECALVMYLRIFILQICARRRWANVP